MEAEQISRKLLEESRKSNGTKDLRRKLANLSIKSLSEDLDTDRKRKAFWLNIYNAFVQILLKERPSRYRFRSLFFMRRYIEVAGKKMSLNKIEHGMLRSSKLSFGFGYLSNPLAFSFEREFRLKDEDPRVHFALNCGAEACPPIKFYRSEEIDSQLEIATENYLNQELEVEDSKAKIPRVFYWFRGDFGGKDGVRKFISSRGYEIDGKNLKHKKWNWKMDLDAFEGEEDE